MEYTDALIPEGVTKDQIIHALETALVEMTARLEMHQQCIEEMAVERLMYCAIAQREMP